MTPFEEERPVESYSAPEERAGINIGDVLLHAIARFPMTIIGFTVLGTVGALVFGLSMPNLYMSGGMVMVQMGAREQLAPQGALDAVRGAGSSAGDELLILMNPELQRRVVEEVGAPRILRSYDPAQLDDEDTPNLVRRVHQLQAWVMGFSAVPSDVLGGPVTEGMIAAAVNEIGDGVDITAQRDTSTIGVSYTAKDPELAELVVNAYLEVFQQRHREIYEVSNELSFISEQLEEAEAAAEAASEALREWRGQDGLYDLPGALDGLTTVIRDLDSQNDLDAIQIQGLDRQLVLLDEQLEARQPQPDTEPGSEPDESTDQPLTAAPRPLAQDFRYNLLLAQLQQLGVQRMTLETTYAQGSEVLQSELERLDGRIAAVQDEVGEIESRQLAQQRELVLAAQAGTIPTLQLPQVDPVLVQLVTQRLGVLQQQQLLAAGIEARELLLMSHRQRLDELLLLEPMFTELQQAVTDTGAHVAQLANAHAQAQILELIDADERMSNLIVTQEGFLPTSKEGPDRAKFLLMGVFGGLAAGLAMATARQILDSRLRYPDGVETALGVPVIGIVPEERRWRRDGRRLRKAMAKQT